MKKSLTKKYDKLTEFDDLFIEYTSNTREFFKERKKEAAAQFGYKLQKVEFHKNNQVYEILSKFITETKSDYLKIEDHLIRSYVEVNRGTTLKIHNSMTISMMNGSHLRFCPYRDGGIEITRVYVIEENQGKKNGTDLMNFLYESILNSLGNFPEMILECTGQVGEMDTLLINPISNQTRFFRKFGFRVCKSKSNSPYYAKMKFDFSKLIDKG